MPTNRRAARHPGLRKHHGGPISVCARSPGIRPAIVTTGRITPDSSRYIPRSSSCSAPPHRACLRFALRRHGSRASARQIIELAACPRNFVQAAVVVVRCVPPADGPCASGDFVKTLSGTSRIIVSNRSFCFNRCGAGTCHSRTARRKQIAGYLARVAAEARTSDIGENRFSGGRPNGMWRYCIVQKVCTRSKAASR